MVDLIQSVYRILSSGKRRLGKNLRSSGLCFLEELESRRLLSHGVGDVYEYNDTSDWASDLGVIGLAGGIPKNALGLEATKGVIVENQGAAFSVAIDGQNLAKDLASTQNVPASAAWSDEASPDTVEISSAKLPPSLVVYEVDKANLSTREDVDWYKLAMDASLSGDYGCRGLLIIQANGNFSIEVSLYRQPDDSPTQIDSTTKDDGTIVMSLTENETCYVEVRGQGSSDGAVGSSSSLEQVDYTLQIIPLTPSNVTALSTVAGGALLNDASDRAATDDDVSPGDQLLSIVTYKLQPGINDTHPYQWKYASVSVVPVKVFVNDVDDLLARCLNIARVYDAQPQGIYRHAMQADSCPFFRMGAGAVSQDIAVADLIPAMWPSSSPEPSTPCDNALLQSPNNGVLDTLLRVQTSLVPEASSCRPDDMAEPAPESLLSPQASKEAAKVATTTAPTSSSATIPPPKPEESSVVVRPDEESRSHGLVPTTDTTEASEPSIPPQASSPTDDPLPENVSPASNSKKEESIPTE